MKLYIRTKIVLAEPMTERFFLKGLKGIERLDQDNRPGYKIINIKEPNGHTSWSPKEAFEDVYREISFEEKDLIEAAEEEVNNK